jgi:5-methylthioribose kinase
MREVTPETAALYLRETGRVPAGRAVDVQACGWGVSNVVMRVQIEGEAPLVLKQSRERLRTQALWLSRLDRIWTERDALLLLAGILPRGTVPEVVFCDEDNYLFAMTCAPEPFVVWKEHLLAGRTDPAVARQAGEILGTCHARTAREPELLRGRLLDTTLFDQLRVDPYYRTIARGHPDLAPRIDALVASMPEAPDPTFVHADFSPKNMLVHDHGLTLVDFETAHRGDPAFDLGFFLSHLILKAFRAAPADAPFWNLADEFWSAYLNATSLDLASPRASRGCVHAAACALARVDGKSRVEYLDPPTQEAVRRFARQALREADPSWPELRALAAREMRGKVG